LHEKGNSRIPYRNIHATEVWISRGGKGIFVSPSIWVLGGTFLPLDAFRDCICVQERKEKKEGWGSSRKANASQSRCSKSDQQGSYLTRRKKGRRRVVVETNRKNAD